MSSESDIQVLQDESSLSVCDLHYISVSCQKIKDSTSFKLTNVWGFPEVCYLYLVQDTHNRKSVVSYYSQVNLMEAEN